MGAANILCATPACQGKCNISFSYFAICLRISLLYTSFYKKSIRIPFSNPRFDRKPSEKLLLLRFLKNPKRHTITAALPYANGPLHIGHIAGAYLPADIYVRYLRLMGEDVAFICGSDEHGAAITLRAKKEGISPKEIVDKYDNIIRKAFVDFGIKFDVYHRTSSDLHHKTAQDFFLELEKKGVFEKESSEQFYDEQHQQFLADRYITGTCPKCGNENAYGDQCEKCGSTLSPTELINPKSTLSGNAPILKKTEHWYLPMEKYQHWINEFITKGSNDGKAHHDAQAWKAHVIGQCKSWIDAGLQSRAMTRDLDWGVKIPLSGAEGKVLYVWLDAPIGYISATKQWAKDNGKNWEDYWKNEDTQLIHFIGKDNIVFHCIIFPILLKSHGQFILPSNVPANEFLNLEGDKISTSRNWAVWLHEYLEEFPDKQDELRYVLCSIAPESKDSEFTWKDYQARVNNELVAILSNFVYRVLSLIEKYFDGTLPIDSPGSNSDLPLTDKQLHVSDEIYRLIQVNDKSILSFKFREALSAIMDIARAGNKYLSDEEPWKKYKKDQPELEHNITVASDLIFCLDIITILAKISEPFLPHISKKIFGMLNLSPEEVSFQKRTTIVESTGQDMGHRTILHRYKANHKLNKAVYPSTKIEDTDIEKQIQKLNASRIQYKSMENTNSTEKALVTFEDFSKMDIRIGEIVAAEKVEKANKLLKLTVATGVGERTIVSGIAEHYSPEEVIGKKVSVLMNLAPRTIRGVESQGMILMAENSEGKLCFVSPEKADFNNGSEIR